MNELMTGFLDWAENADATVLLAVNGHHNTYWDTFMWLCSHRFAWIPLYLSILYVLVRNLSWRALLLCLIAMGLVLVVTDAFNSQLLRPWIGRMRPSNLNNPLSAYVHIVDNHRGGCFGFPSSHSSNAWGLVFFVALLLRRWLLSWFLAAWAFLLCYSRLYLGVHYPGDLLAGMLLGGLSAWLFYGLYVRVSNESVPATLCHPYVPVVVGGVQLVAFLLAPLFFTIA